MALSRQTIRFSSLVFLLGGLAFGCGKSEVFGLNAGDFDAGGDDVVVNIDGGPVFEDARTDAFVPDVIDIFPDVGIVDTGFDGGQNMGEAGLSDASITPEDAMIGDGPITSGAMISDGPIMTGDAMISDGPIMTGDAMISDGPIITGDAMN